MGDRYSFRIIWPSGGRYHKSGTTLGMTDKCNILVFRFISDQIHIGRDVIVTNFVPTEVPIFFRVGVEFYVVGTVSVSSARHQKDVETVFHQ